MTGIDITPNFRWRVAAASVRGAMHSRNGKENQDAFGWAPESGVEMPLAAAVADGHGNNKSFRSARGARLAVETAKRVLMECGAIKEWPLTLSAFKHLTEERLAQALSRRWRKEVAADLLNNPLTDAELGALEEKDGSAARKAVAENPHLAYGTTLLAVLVASDFILYVQAGDGDIVTVSANGEASRPLPPDARLFANETTSMSASDAWRDFRVRFQCLNGTPPALIVLSSDGYANSFNNDEGFLAAAPDILSRARAEGMGIVQNKLTEWLTAATQNGSGDDTTVLIIKHGEDGDIDRMLERLSACERAIEELLVCIKRILSLEENDDACTPRLENLKEQLGAQEKRLRAQWRLTVAALALASASVLLASLLAIRGAITPETDKRASRDGVAQPPSESSSDRHVEPESFP